MEGEGEYEAGYAMESSILGASFSDDSAKTILHTSYELLSLMMF